MKTKTFYICETCGAEYEHEAIAIVCEGQPKLPLCPVSVGQSVRVYERYDVPEVDEVVEIIVGPPLAASISVGSRSPEEFLECARHLMGHSYRIRIKNEHQMSKDQDSYTDTVFLTDIMVNGKFLEEEPL